MSELYDHIVIGGGISGLSKAYALQKKGSKVLLLEKKKNTGGVINSEVTTHGVTEYGPNSLSVTPKLSQLIKELNLESEVIKADEAANKRYVFLNGKPVLINPKTLLFSNKVIGFGSKLKLITERFRPAKNIPRESLADTIRRRFNDEILTNLVEPIIAGIYAGSPEMLEYKSSMARLYDMEQKHGSFTKGFMAAKKTGSKREIVSFKGGLQTLTNTLRDQLSDIQYEGAESITLEDGKVTVKTAKQVFEAKELYLAVPAYVAAQLVEPMADDLAKNINEVSYPTLLGWQVTFNTSDITNRIPSFGILFPAVSHKAIKGIINYSEIFGTKEDVRHYTIFAAANAENKEQIQQQVQEELKAVYNIQGEPIESYFTFYEKSIPQMNVGHSELMEKVDHWQKEHPQVNFIGNWRTGVAIGECVNI